MANVRTLTIDGVTYNLQDTVSGYAPLASPALTGTPTAPTASNGDSSTQIATTAFVQNALSGAGAGTVTSVAVSNDTDGGLSVSGSPITSSGTITVGHSNVLTSAQTTQAVYPIKIDKNGHISSYGSAFTIPDVSGKLDTSYTGSSTIFSVDYSSSNGGTFNITGTNSAGTAGTGINITQDFRLASMSSSKSIELDVSSSGLNTYVNNTGTGTSIFSINTSSTAGSVTIHNLVTPTSNDDAATKKYVDDSIPTVPTITLNGSSTTSPSFYAPTSAGTSGYVLKSNGSGAPTWTSATLTDTKLQVAEVTSSTVYYPIVGTGTTAATRQYDTTGFKYTATNGTTSSTGSSTLTLGNNTAYGTANNKTGVFRLYGSGNKAADIQGPDGTGGNIYTVKLPENGGTIALTSDIPTVPTKVSELTNDSGFVTSSGVTSVTIAATSPVASSTPSAQTGSSVSTTISLNDAYGDTKIHMEQKQHIMC